MVGLLATFLFLDFRYFEIKHDQQEKANRELKADLTGVKKSVDDVLTALSGQAEKIEAGEPLTAQAQKQAKLLEKQTEQIGKLENKTTRLLNVMDRSVKVLDKVKTRQDGRGIRISEAEQLIESIDKRVTVLENSLDPKVKPLTPREKTNLKKLRTQGRRR